MTFQPRSIFWKPVIGVAVMQGAITLLWLVYNLYIPQLLTALGFPPTLGIVLLTIESLLGAVLEPLSGIIADRYPRAMGIRFPLVMLSTIAAAMLFGLIPLTASMALTLPILKVVFFILLMAWATAMALFRVPVLALLGSYADSPQLPKAASAVSLAGAIVQLFSTPVHKAVLLDLGPIGAFVLGSVVLFLAVGVLNLAEPQQSVTPGTQAKPQVPSQETSLVRIGTLVFLGASIALGLVFLRKLLQPQPSVDFGLSVFMAGNLLALLPAGWMASRVGSRKCLVTALLSSIACVVAMASPLSGLWPFIWFILGVAVAFIVNAVMPIVLAQATSNRAGFATGAYFGGVSVAGVISNVLTLTLGTLSPEFIIVGTIGCFVGAIGCVGTLVGSEGE